MNAHERSSDNLITIFVGTDRSQLFAVSVLEHSIKRNTTASVKVVPLDNETACVPMPEDIRHGPRTGFSFVRFAIPELMGFRGRALYLDADMLVFGDIRELWNWDFNGHHIQIVGDTRKSIRKGKFPQRRIRQCSVMLIDCESCNWDAKDIVGKLGKQYSYEKLMYEMCFMAPNKIGDSIPFRWNSLEFYDSTTCLIHYTDMYTQPWVEPSNSHGHLWVNEVRKMLDESVITYEDINNEIEEGYIRPSLVDELKNGVCARCLNTEEIKKFQSYDISRGYIKHREITEHKRERLRKIREFEKGMTFRQLLQSLPTRETSSSLIKLNYIWRKMTGFSA